MILNDQKTSINEGRWAGKVFQNYNSIGVNIFRKRLGVRIIFKSDVEIIV